MATSDYPVVVSQGFDTFTWKWMRYSAFLLIPIVWIHFIIQDLITGGHNLSLEYVQMRWVFIGWRIYDLFLLVFAFSHGVFGLRQVLLDYIKSPAIRKTIGWGILVYWLVLTTIGAIAILGGVRMP